MSYQDKLFFLNRYKTVVYGTTKENLDKYITEFKLTEKRREEIEDLISEKTIRKVSDNWYEYIITKYAEYDCDYTYTRDCAAELTRKLIEHFGLPQ